VQLEPDRSDGERCGDLQPIVERKPQREQAKTYCRALSEHGESGEAAGHDAEDGDKRISTGSRRDAHLHPTAECSVLNAIERLDRKWHTLCQRRCCRVRGHRRTPVYLRVATQKKTGSLYEPKTSSMACRISYSVHDALAQSRITGTRLSSPELA